MKKRCQRRGFSKLVDDMNSAVQDDDDEEARLLAEKGFSADLRFLKDPVQLGHDHAFYRNMLRIGRGGDQPGADLSASWYHRNLPICANLLQILEPNEFLPK